MLSKFNLLKQLAVSMLIFMGLPYLSYGSIFYSPDSDLKLIKEQSFHISTGKNLVVELNTGDVKVTYWNKSEVSIKIWGDDDAEEKMNFSVEGNDEEIKIIGKKKSSSFSWFSGIDVKVEVKVPSEFNMEISTAGGDIKWGGITGKANLSTSGGDVWADKFSGDINVSTSGGDIFLFCKDAEINAETSSGDIRLEYDGENRGIEISTSGGDIEIKLPKMFNAAVELSTSGGDVSCSLSMNNINKASGSRLIGDINSGGEKLSAHTSGGDITVTGY